MFSVLEMLIDSIHNHEQRSESVEFIPVFQVTDSLLSQHLNFFSLCHLTHLSSLLLKSNLDFYFLNNFYLPLTSNLVKVHMTSFESSIHYSAMGLK